MKPSIGVAVSLIVVLIGGLSFVTHWFGDQSASKTLSAPVQLSTSVTEAPGLRTMVELEAAATIPRADTSTQLVETYQQDIAALRQEVTLLRRKVVTMQQQLRAQRQMIPDIPQGREDPTVKELRTDPARAEEERAQHERMESFEATFRQESTDPQWANAEATAVRAALSGDDIGQLALQNLECRSNSCRVELADDGTGGLAKSLPLFIQHLAETLPYATANQVANGASGTSLILYMSRDTNASLLQSK
ncbi:conserved hypothetical protein [Gammaproteobacteria bacterium]